MFRCICFVCVDTNFLYCCRSFLLLQIVAFYLFCLYLLQIKFVCECKQTTHVHTQINSNKFKQMNSNKQNVNKQNANKQTNKQTSKRMQTKECKQKNANKRM